MLQLVRDQLDVINERADIVHSHYKINEVPVSFDLSFDSLNRLISNVSGSERTIVPCTAKKSPAKQN
jgi:hypothetical protein